MTNRFVFSVMFCALALVTSSVHSQFYSEPLNSNPGWTISGGEWEFGAPTGSNGDPSAAYTGANVYGYDLTGLGTNPQRYESLIPEYHLTTQAINCTGRSNVHLSFARWLGVESATYDHAYVRISNDGGIVWHDVWAHSGSTLNETAWTVVDYDVSAWADNQADVRIRWTMGTTDSSVVYHGWNIDDIQMYEFNPANLNMLSPIGTGTVSPPVGTTVYSVGSIADIIATPAFGFDFDYWQVDGVFYSSNATDTLVMNTDHDVQAFFDALPILYYEDFAVDPGWTLEGGWDWGAATASSGCSGNQDPDYDVTGEGNILGYEIGGCYPSSMAATEWATSPVLDFTGYIDVQLGFSRWLGVESALFDYASIEVYDGSTWNVVWDHTGSSFSDPDWTTQLVDISAYADNNANVQIRFGMGPTDDSVTYCGWNIDGIGFTGDIPGYISGYVTTNSGATPVLGATVSVDGTAKTAVSQGPAGYYSIAIGPGTYDLTVTAPGYNDGTATGVAVTQGMTTTQNFDLTYPDISVDPTSLSVTLDWGDTQDEYVTIYNNGTGPLEWTSSFSPDTKAAGDLLYDLATGLLTADTQCLGAEFAFGSIWITGANSGTDPNYLYEVSADGTTLLNTFTQPAAATGWGLRDMASDGTYLYAGTETMFYQINPSDGSVVSSASNPFSPDTIRALAYNPDSGTFFTQNFASVTREFSFDGSTLTLIRSFNLVEPAYGLAWDSYSPGGPFLWLFSDDESGTGSVLLQADVSTPGSEALTGINYPVPLLSGLTDMIYGGCFVTTDWVPGKVVIGGNVQGTPDDKVFGLELGDYATWCIPNPASGIIPASSSEVLTVTFDSNEVDSPGLYTGNLKIASNDVSSPTLVPCSMLVTGGGDLNGFVSDSSKGPVVGATVTVVEAGRSTTTDVFGYYELLQLPAGSFTVTCTATGYNNYSYYPVEIVQNMTTTHNISMLYPDIFVTPLTYDKWQQPDVVDTVNNAITIRNDGDGVLTWNLTTQYINKKGNRDSNVLLVTPDVVGGGDISPLLAILDSYPDIIYTIWDASVGTPSVVDMQAYDVVFVGNTIVWTLSAIDKTVLSNNLADYIDAGGRVLAADYIWSYDQWGLEGGRFITGNYSPFNIATLDYWNPDSLGTFDPNHPIMAGVTTLTDNYGHQDPAMTSGSALVASYATTGYNYIGDAGGVCVGINQVLFSGADFGGDVDTMVYNAINYLSGAITGWLTTTPTSGTVPAGSSVQLDLTFDSTDIPYGDYDAILHITSDGGSADVDVTLHVSDVTPTPTTPPVIPTTGPAGVGLLLLAIGALMNLAGVRRRK